MKKKLIALVCALALAVGLVGCSLSTPDSVGTIGEVDIPSGLYLLAQFDAYQTAADLASDDQDATKVSSFLKATITVDDVTGETAVVSDYVAQKTLENLESYAAIETRFDELGGVLTPDEEAQADSYASQLMEQNGDLYKANGIGLDTLKRFERILIKSNDLLEMCYGTDGEAPVSDAELTSHLEDEMVYIRYVVVPFYNTSTFAFADNDQSAQMLELAQTAAESCNAATPDGASARPPLSAPPSPLPCPTSTRCWIASPLPTLLLSPLLCWVLTTSMPPSPRKAPPTLSAPSSPARPLPCSIPAMR